MDFARLVTPDGQHALAEARQLLGKDRLAAITALRERFDPGLAADALSQAALRERAVAKFGEGAWGMYFTAAGLEQATRPIVAARRAERLGASRNVVDLGCGIGSDLMHLGGTGIERDPDTAKCAELNVPAARVIPGDAQDFDLSTVDTVFCDPARRSGGKRVFNPRDYSPPWDWVVSLPERVPRTVLKLAPGIDQSLLPPGCELELVSVDGDVVEAAAWCGPLARVPRRATVIRKGVAHELAGTGTRRAPVGEPRRYVYDPDGAVVRAHLVAEFASTVDGVLGDPSIAYVYSSIYVENAFSRAFEIDEIMPFSLKRLRAALRARDVGRLEILKRGSAVDVETLRRELKLGGTNAASLMLTRIAGDPVAVILR
ncbi:class I SAM-dependent methyltransferase [Allorhizocola rhizosphaerae]|uniref:class I SAM-dependent methyltransferase n=1 Tax=Allorhizocola rhizosphaerae TaxID=1872709 RepID=UPI0013C2A9E0|nr:class I SAM-dependent methyltransferase [Allorhizocola rhizosphaerae]